MFAARVNTDSQTDSAFTLASNIYIQGQRQNRPAGSQTASIFTLTPTIYIQGQCQNRLADSQIDSVLL